MWIYVQPNNSMDQDRSNKYDYYKDITCFQAMWTFKENSILSEQSR